MNEEAKAKMLEMVAQWLDDPANSTRFTLEFTNVRHPQTQQLGRVYSIKVEATMAQIQVMQAAPSIIVPPSGTVPPSNRPF